MALHTPSIDSMGVDRNNYPDAASNIFHQIPVEEHKGESLKFLRSNQHRKS